MTATAAPPTRRLARATPPPDGPGGEGWGPVEVGGRGQRGLRRAGKVLLAIVLGIVLLVGATAVAVLQRASAAIDRIPVDGLAGGSGPTHVLVVGSDSREQLSDDERRALSTGYTEGVRTDTIFVLSVDGPDAAVLAFPRDLWLERCDGTMGRINAAYQHGGPGCLVETVSAASGLPISHYLEVDFLGFRDLVDAVGGVELCLDRPIRDKDSGTDLPAGCQVLDGTDALGYVRVRKIDNDLERIKRQQQFVKALAKAMASQDVANPATAFRLAGALGGTVTADDGLGTFDLLQLGRAVRGVASGGLAATTVPVEPAVIDGADVLVPAPGAAAVFAATASGATLRPAEPELVPGDVAVAVLNGTGVPGLAGTTADELDAAGFDVRRTGNEAPPGLTTILHAPDDETAARLLADALPIRPQLRSADVDVVTLVLGADYPVED